MKKNKWFQYRNGLGTGLLVLPLLLSGAFSNADDSVTELMKTKISSFVASEKERGSNYQEYEVLTPPGTKLLSVEESDKSVILTFNKQLGYRPWFPESAQELQDSLGKLVVEAGLDGKEVVIQIRYKNDKKIYDLTLEEHITSPEQIKVRQEGGGIEVSALLSPVVDRVDYVGPSREQGLQNRNIFVSGSHGYTWHKENRWQYQRARVYTIVEDLFPTQYVNMFIAPMLENAGATVWSPRERDYQKGEVIVDNDGTTPLSSFEKTGTWTTVEGGGWSGGRPAVLAQDTEPFTLGTTAKAEVVAESSAQYIPYIPHQGRYSVYASWEMDKYNSPSVPVTITHLGGQTTVHVNQQVAGKTWVLLGFFEFAQGADKEKGSVSLSTQGAVKSSLAEEDGVATTVSIDAVRFGGGMGNVAPDDKVSGKSRAHEAGTYWMQYAGAPKEAVYLRRYKPGHFGLDYVSDYISRGEWANYINGAPNGPTPYQDKDYRQLPGLGVPIDVTFSFHTDAGFDEEGMIGTLNIYRAFDGDGKQNFPDGRSRWLNRDLSALVQEEVVRTSRELYTSSWHRRHLHERELSETRRPNMPSTLIELVSHHNFNDMKYGIDPRFQFDISRAMYKAILRFVSYSNGYDPIIQPLAPDHISVKHVGNGEVMVSWLAVADPLEPTADPTGYIVYQSADGRSFDNGTLAEKNSFTVSVPEDTNSFYRVTAVNEGGESFPTAVAGVRWDSEKQPVLIVDGFNRISGPKIIHRDRTHGFDRLEDAGVAYQYNYQLVGDQYDFDPKHKWMNDLETPGMGASSNNWEDRLEMGNTFDHIVRHGMAFGELDYPFDSATADAYTEGQVTGDYSVINWIAGEQKAVIPFEGMLGNGRPDKMKTEFPVLTDEGVDRLTNHLNNGGKFLMSGAYIVSDLTFGPLSTMKKNEFVEEELGVEMVISEASQINQVSTVSEESSPFSLVEPFYFGRDLEPVNNILPTVYPVESPEGFIADGEVAKPVLAYGDSAIDAVIASEDTVLMGFPLETVLPVGRRAELLKASLIHLNLMEAETTKDEGEK